MGNFVGSDNLPVTMIAPIYAEFMTNGVVEVIANGNPDEAGPGLSEIACSLLGDVNLRELRRAKVIGVELDGKFAFREGFFIELSGVHGPEGDAFDVGTIKSTRNVLVADRTFQGFDPGRGILVSKRLDENRGLGEFGFFDFEFAETKARDGLRRFTFPNSDILIAVVGIADECARGGHLHAFGNAERHVIGSIFTETGGDIVGIPVLAGDGEIIVATFVRDSILARVGGGEGELIASGKRFGKNDGEIGVVIFVFLDVGEALSVGAGNGFHAKGGKER